MKKSYLSFISVLVVCIFFNVSLSANEGEGHNISSNTHIAKWLVAGSFPNPRNLAPAEGESWMKGFDHDFLVSIGGEQNAVLTAGQVIEYQDFDNVSKSVEVFQA